MDPVTAAMAAAGLISNLVGNSNATSTAANNLQFQRDQAANSNRLATATKVDANGNSLVYDPATNTWKDNLTPLQQAIQNAGQSEQLKTLTTDAAQNRQLAKRNQQYSLDAGTPYNTAIQNYINMQPKSEAADKNDLETGIIQSAAASGRGNQAILERQALRLGQGGQIPALIKSTDDQIGTSVPSAMLQALQGASTKRNTDVQNHNSEFLPQIQALKQIIDQGGTTSSPNYGNLESQVAAGENSSQSAMLSAIQAANSGINTASGALTTAEGKPVDFAKMITALNSGKGKTAATKTDAEGNPVSTDMPDYGDISQYLNNVPQNLGMTNDFIS